MLMSLTLVGFSWIDKPDPPRAEQSIVMQLNAIQSMDLAIPVEFNFLQYQNIDIGMLSPEYSQGCPTNEVAMGNIFIFNTLNYRQDRPPKITNDNLSLYITSLTSETAGIDLINYPLKIV